MLSKDEMAVRLAEIRWTINAKTVNAEKMTKAEILEVVQETSQSVATLEADHRKPRKREVQMKLPLTGE